MKSLFMLGWMGIVSVLLLDKTAITVQKGFGFASIIIIALAMAIEAPTQPEDRDWIVITIANVCAGVAFVLHMIYVFRSLFLT